MLQGFPEYLVIIHHHMKGLLLTFLNQQSHLQMCLKTTSFFGLCVFFLSSMIQHVESWCRIDRSNCDFTVLTHYFSLNDAFHDPVQTLGSHGARSNDCPRGTRQLAPGLQDGSPVLVSAPVRINPALFLSDFREPLQNHQDRELLFFFVSCEAIVYVVFLHIRFALHLCAAMLVSQFVFQHIQLAQELQVTHVLYFAVAPIFVLIVTRRMFLSQQSIGLSCFPCVAMACSLHANPLLRLDGQRPSPGLSGRTRLELLQEVGFNLRIPPCALS